MIPVDYKRSVCGLRGVKLWRQYQTCADQIQLMCAACAEKNQGEKIDLSRGDQCGWMVPAIPTLNGSWWGYSSVPPEGVAWWRALPLALEGDWKVRGGVERWTTYREWQERFCAHECNEDDLRRVDFARGMALIFVAESGEGKR